MTLKPRIERKSVPYKLNESVYSQWDGGKFSRVAAPDKVLPETAQQVFEEFRTHISSSDFSCIGAKAALNGSLFRIALYPPMNLPETGAALGRDLSVFAGELKESTSNFASFAAVFETPQHESEKIWEASLWKQLENLHRLDPSPLWDPSVGSDPAAADFSFSFNGTGFFIVGLHPQSSRLARRFSHAAMIFNPHAQFDRLRETGQYARMQQTIRSRELKLQGSLNPNLSDFGAASEARQYSGRAVEENWKCPFLALSSKFKKS